MRCPCSVPGCLLVFCIFPLLGCTPVEKRIAENIAVLKNQNATKEQRRDAANKLSGIGTRAIPALFDLMRPEYRHAEYFIAYSLAGMGDACFPALVKGLEDKETFVRGCCATMAASAGRRLGPHIPAAVAGLKSILERDFDEPALQGAAAMALKELGKNSRPAVPGLLAAALSNDWTLCGLATKALDAIDSSTLKLVPGHPPAKGLFSSFGTHNKWDLARMTARVGRLEYGRQDRNGDWKLTRDEISSVTQLRNALDRKKGEFLTFGEAGQTAFDSFLHGYVDGQAERNHLDVEVVWRQVEGDIAKCGVASMMLSWIQKADADKNGVLSDQEYRAWKESRK